jgi:hypothetical protein
MRKAWIKAPASWDLKRSVQNRSSPPDNLENTPVIRAAYAKKPIMPLVIAAQPAERYVDPAMVAAGRIVIGNPPKSLN